MSFVFFTAELFSGSR
jgi:hypothetical protein